MRTTKINQFYSLPNMLTIIRIGVIPLLVVFYYLPMPWAHMLAAIIFLAASVTDWLDGYLARYLKQTTQLGAFLDPVADKIMVSIALIIIVAEPTFQFINLHSAVITIPTFVITIPAGVIVIREIIVSALREWMAELGKRASVAVSGLGKIKTTAQMIALIILLYCDNTTSTFVILVGYVFLYLSAILTIWSMCLYLKAAWKQLSAV